MGLGVNGGNMRWLLRFFGYYKIDYGFSCGRHWMEIDGKIVAQTAGDDVWLRDEDVHALVVGTIGAGHGWELTVRDLHGNAIPPFEFKFGRYI